ncbi:lysozyme inhibitor LprI family protein [Brevundimonas subvibrioides]|uniref:Lysozyme inhibitor LprI-like N-terminal domain-containing protein n=1 Tax=Brevundimonas subvibrioides (strain ATCC 15264 / DSM 4735 / LMG 14903 / NBRC 16000 / CB 81) TaxID=633149 RepID=D9QMQ1_BRESC|nr:lysozyme inhibitor LprI family protein [Brevundimonas subvibrioides]ADL00221.1 conserved hypothetical protein [Brevundimonas subvibrioides ATCC 15264]
MRSGLAAVVLFTGVMGAGALVPVGPGAQAASFDCTRARRADEVAICGNRALEDADVRMSTTYTLVLQLVGMGMRGDLRDSQTAWLRERGRCGGNVTCIARSYRARTQRLEAVFQTVVRQGPF